MPDQPHSIMIAWSELVFGHPLRSDEESTETIGPVRGVGVLGLDALASAAYGPEAALTVLLPAGAFALRAIGPIMAVIIALLVAVYLSYRQTIAAYPGGGGSFTVASQNLGRVPGMMAASALALDYILNVAVAIAAGVGAVVSAVPSLLPYTLALCLAILGLITILNLRGIREAGIVLMTPTWLFVAALGITLVVGVVKTLLAGGHPAPVAAPPPMHATTMTALGAWLVVRAFANGTTAMTGVEAVSNAVPIFREPTVKHAQRTLTLIIAILVGLLVGIAFLAHAFHIGATVPGRTGYQSVLSQLIAAVMGRGAFYYVSIAAILAVLCLSANTSFAGFPRVCRLLALDDLLPPSFAHRGPRLVFTQGILVLAALSAVLLIVFGGITDRLIPLFAIGALTAFTLSQWGMVAHWLHRPGERRRLRSLAINGIGATATSITVVIVLASKLVEGAWISLLVIGAFMGLLQAYQHHRRLVDRMVGRGTAPRACLAIPEHEPPIIVVPIARLDRVACKGLALAVTMSPEVHAVQVLTDDPDRTDLRPLWEELVVDPMRAQGLSPPQLATVPSQYRELFTPLLGYVRRVAAEHPRRFVAVIVAELVPRRWYHRLFRTRQMLLKALLRHHGGPQVVILDTPWHLAE